MIPYEFLSKMGHFQVEVHGVKVKVSVVADEARLIDKKISELRSLLQRRVMGLDFEMSNKFNCPAMLLLCVEGHCLIIPKLDRLFEYYPKDASKSGLGQLLSDRTICFLTCNLCTNITTLRCYYADLRNMIEGTDVELGHLAGRILKKPKLEKCELAKLASEVGIDIKPLLVQKIEEDIKPLSGGFPDDWVDKVIFSEEEIKYAVHNVYGSYLVGNKLLGML